MVKTIGFLVNPIAGMGGKVALKGTDFVVKEAIRRGATEIAPLRAQQFLKYVNLTNAMIFTCADKMGENVIIASPWHYKVVYVPKKNTDRYDTINAVMIFQKLNVDIIVFVGGDGTARDVAEKVSNIPILGVPSGVKMYSAVFANRPKEAAEVLNLFLEDRATLTEAEILDIDEIAYRKNILKIKFYKTVLTPYVENLTQSSKAEYYGEGEEQNKIAIAEYVLGKLDKNTLYLLGAGTTVKKLLELLNLRGTLLGIDALYNNTLVGKDLDEKSILKLFEIYPHRKIILSPIGNQGFIIGRGNLQFSLKVLEKISRHDLIIVATMQKVKNLQYLRIDSGSPIIDKKFESYYKVIVGFERMKVLKLIT